MFKGRDQVNQGEILYVEDWGEKDGGFVLNILTDMYNNRLDEEVSKILRKKERAKSYSDIAFTLENAKDWRGNTITKFVNGLQATKMKGKASFTVTSSNLFESTYQCQ